MKKSINMKLFSKALCIAFVLTVFYSLIPFEAECNEISNEVFRIHILANSDSQADQNLKLKVRDEILAYSEELFNSANSKEEAEKIVQENLAEIIAVAQKKVYDEGYDYKVDAEITNMYFTTRYYEQFTMPSGMYDALRVTIGEGEGQNWWCVMYPSICLSASIESDEKAKESFTDNQYDIVSSGEYQYRFKVVEIFEKITSFFAEDNKEIF
ncbi:MAG: stage II sporulation protein R [Ruminococcus sp.]|nr:stage II sporulation protein R [Ruminococcus sp.]